MHEEETLNERPKVRKAHLYRVVSSAAFVTWFSVAGCSSTDSVVDVPSEPETVTVEEVSEDVVAEVGPWIDADIFGVANGCFSLAPADRSMFAFENVNGIAASVYLLRPTDLGQYVLYDEERRYLAAEAVGGSAPEQWTLFRTADKERIRIPHHQKYSNAEWQFEPSGRAEDVYRVRHLRSDLYLGVSGLVAEPDAAAIRLVPREGCVQYPELSVDAHGEIRKAPWDNGDVYGIADIHSHIFTHVAYGGGGIFHGAPFHRLGVEHALDDCEGNHGSDGKRDIFGHLFHGDWSPDIDDILAIVADGKVEDPVHSTDGYPTFTDWPNPRKAGSHQAQYYRWIERAWMGGLRLVVELATGNSVLCNIMVGIGSHEAPYGCNDMDSVDRGITEARAMERHIDALWGGPGKGWFRIVDSPTAAREVINKGKLAVVLGIEISNLFDCFLAPPPGKPACDESLVLEQMKEYYEAGVRVVYPAHKFDNGFSPGDAQRGPMELFNIVNAGHWSNFVQDCPGVPSFGDKGGVTFGGVNKPRDVYEAPPVLDFSGIQTDLIATVYPLIPDVYGSGPLEGEWCQNGTLTPLGELLFDELMSRGMIIDISHLPQRSVKRALEILDQNQYPGISTHWNTHEGKIYRHGGISTSGLGRCASLDEPDTMGSGFRNRTAEVQEANGLPAQPLGFDLNGFAGSPGPRFGDDSGCAQPQANPITYPFFSYDGLVEFTEPRLGERTVDFNTEGMIHVGLLPEYIEDVRRDGMSDADLEPLFRTAEAFIRVWEQAEARRGR